MSLLKKPITAVIASTGGKHKPYLKLIDEQRATIGCYAVEHGTVNTICRFKGDFPQDSLRESIIRGWKNAYLQSRRREGKAEW